MKCDPSVSVPTAPASGAEKLGQPVPLSNFVSDAIDLGKVITSPIYGADLTSFEFE